MYLQFSSSVSCENIQEVLDHVTTICPISEHSVLFEFPKESDQEVLEPLLCGYIQNILSVRADCLATNTEYCDRCTHAATQATNVARIKTEGTKGLLQGQVAG
jgi:hypothetical protein